MADLESSAPSHVDVRVGTSSHTDEFIAQRLGLRPRARRVGRAGERARLRPPVLIPTCRGRCTAATVLPLGRGQEVDLTIHFARHGEEHARPAHGGRGMQAVDVDPDGLDPPTRHEDRAGREDDHASC